MHDNEPLIDGREYKALIKGKEVKVTQLEFDLKENSSEK